jgi:hypothetical protein
MNVQWDASFESGPENTIDISTIPAEVTRMKRGISERMGIEHYWGQYNADNTTDKNLIDSGKHVPGYTTIADYDTSTIRGNLSPQTGALYVEKKAHGADDDTILEVYSGTAWLPISATYHCNLGGIGDYTVHPQYVAMDASAPNVCTDDWNNGGQLLFVTNAAAQGLLTANHIYSGTHVIDSLSLHGIIPLKNIWIKRNTSGVVITLVDSGTHTITYDAEYTIALDPAGFFPSVLVYWTTAIQPPAVLGVKERYVTMALNGSNLVLHNYCPGTVSVRVRQWGFATGGLA